MKNIFLGFFIIAGLLSGNLTAQVRWENVDALYRPLPSSIHVYCTHDSLGNKPNIAYYVKMPLLSPDLIFGTDTALNRGLTPSAYFERDNHPVLVTNCTFFSPEHRNIGVVIDEGKMISFNLPSVLGKEDSMYHYVTRSALGINRHRKADVAWIYTDAERKKAFEMKQGPVVCSGVNAHPALKEMKRICNTYKGRWKKPWKMKTAVGGGPALISDGVIHITNEQERMFMGQAINDRHPRTAMGYTAEGELIILSVEGRFPGIAEGATLMQEATLLKDLGCFEALNLDGGGSSCLLINGKQTITPSDKTGQRPVPGVFIVKTK